VTESVNDLGDWGTARVPDNRSYHVTHLVEALPITQGRSSYWSVAAFAGKEEPKEGPLLLQL
jgi:hypothetical protein